MNELQIAVCSRISISTQQSRALIVRCCMQSNSHRSTSTRLGSGRTRDGLDGDAPGLAAQKGDSRYLIDSLYLSERLLNKNVCNAIFVSLVPVIIVHKFQ